MSQDNIRRTSLRLSLLTLAMFGFGFALIPLYDKLCEVTGFGGRTNETAIAAESLEKTMDEQRSIKIEFVSRVNAGAPWEFKPKQPAVTVHPGEFTQVEFVAENLADAVMAGKAVPSVAPAEGSLFFQKIECFCFTKQSFEPFESKDMPVVFRVDPKLPDHIDTLTLSYTFFNLEET